MDCAHVARSSYLCSMKYLILTIFSLGISVKALGQFNTISNSPSLYRVHPIMNSTTTQADSDMLEIPKDSTPPATSVTDDVHDAVSTIGKTVGMDVDSMKQELIQRYLSVSYPLSHIQVTSTYGMRNHPILRKKMMHQGIDLRAKYEEVYSVMDGEVVAVSSDKRSGRYVTLRYPGAYTCSYCHLSQPLVKKGDSVKAGEVIAISGNTGMSTSAHLHFGVKSASGERLDPMVLLEFIRKTREDVIRGLRELHSIASEES